MLAVWRRPGLITRVITGWYASFTSGSYRGVGEGASRAIGAGLGRAGPHWHDLVLALAHLYVSNSSTGCLRPSVRPEGSFGNLTKRV